MRQPHVQDVHQQRRLEEERIRIRHHVSQATRNALSIAYVTQLPQFGHLPDYWTLINELHRRLLPLEPGMTILDIGCGVGDFVRALLTNHVYRSVHHSGSPAVPLRYIGLDQSHESLKLAQQQIHTFTQEILGTLKSAAPVTQFVETQWLQTDWASPLPFIDDSISHVLCQLALPFAPSPLACLRQALRVLHPEGTAVVTCFQPHTDLSPLFQRHFRAAGHDESSSQAQIALHFLSRLREAIRHGILHSYERNEFACLLSHAGAGLIQIYPALDNQMLLAVVKKGKSTG
jgi:ubiquinone/menaquinone biosynthesis C-methylase UbiE